MRILKLLLKWVAVVALILVAFAACLMPIVAVWAQMGSIVGANAALASFFIILACMFLISCLMEYNP